MIKEDYKEIHIQIGRQITDLTDLERRVMFLSSGTPDEISIIRQIRKAMEHLRKAHKKTSRNL